MWDHIVSESASCNNDLDCALIAAHANTLQALGMHLDDVTADAIEGLNIPTAIPFWCNICKETKTTVGKNNGVNGEASSGNREKMKSEFSRNPHDG